MPITNTASPDPADAPPAPDEPATPPPAETSGADPVPDAEPTPDPAAPAATPEAAPELEPGRYRFTGPYAQTYMAPPSFVAEPGESYDWPAGPPADGRWIKEN